MSKYNYQRRYKITASASVRPRFLQGSAHQTPFSHSSSTIPRVTARQTSDGYDLGADSLSNTDNVSVSNLRGPGKSNQSSIYGDVSNLLLGGYASSSLIPLKISNISSMPQSSLMPHYPDKWSIPASLTSAASSNIDAGKSISKQNTITDKDPHALTLKLMPKSDRGRQPENNPIGIIDRITRDEV